MNHGTVRIIGGKWRSRKLTFPAIAGLRPTTDRVRETVFNWLAPFIMQARCLDLFAGSGALGFEALSRGAAEAVFVDSSKEVIAYLKEQARILQTTDIETYQLHLPCPVPFTHKKFDIVFLDPPFHQGLISPICQWLEEQNLLADEALIYLETEAELSPLPVPQNWVLMRSKKAGQAAYHLAKRTSLPLNSTMLDRNA
jgi:16S rRNA (guanine966-N2)-methyltransferase